MVLIEQLAACPQDGPPQRLKQRPQQVGVGAGEEGGPSGALLQGVQRVADGLVAGLRGDLKVGVRVVVEALHVGEVHWHATRTVV